MVLVLIFSLTGFAAEKEAIQKYEAAKKSVEEKLEAISAMMKQIRKDQNQLEKYRPHIEKGDKMLTEFEEAFFDTARLIPPGYEMDYDRWAQKIMKQLEIMELR